MTEQPDLPTPPEGMHWEIYDDFNTPAIRLVGQQPRSMLQSMLGVKAKSTVVANEHIRAHRNDYQGVRWDHLAPDMIEETAERLLEEYLREQEVIEFKSKYVGEY